MGFLEDLYMFINSIDFSPLKAVMDLNDLRNLAAIAGVVLTVHAASRKWGSKAIYHASISKSLNSPARISSLSIANLKDKPLIVYELHVRFTDSKHYFCLQKFDPPMVIKGLEATTLEPEAYSSLGIEPNPFNQLSVDIELFLATERAIVKCKKASPPGVLVQKYMKGLNELTKSKNTFNKKIYTSEAAFALVYQYKGEQRTSFLLRYGFICDEWPFQLNALPSTAMKNDESVIVAINDLSQELATKIHLQKLIQF